MFDPISLAVNAGISIVSASLQARATKAKEIQLPEAEESRCIPYVAGTVKITDPVLLWSGDFKTSSVRTEFPTWLNILAPVTAIIDQLPFGYRYYNGFAFGLARGRVATDLTGVYVNDKLVWSGTAFTGSLTVSAPGVFGKEGGVYAQCNFAPGAFPGSSGVVQNRNTYLNSFIPNCSAFPGTMVFYWKGPSSGAPAVGKIKYGGYVGRTPALKPFAFRVTSFPNVNNTPASLTDYVNTNEAVPSLVIRDWLTSDLFGLGLSSDDIDELGFGLVGLALQAENFGCSVYINQKRQALDVLQDLCDTIDACLYTSYESPNYGKVAIKLIRDDYVVADLPVLDETNIKSLSNFRRGAQDDTVTEVRVRFTDPSNNFTVRTAVAQGTGTYLNAGRPNAVTIDRLGLCNKDTAEKVATRELMALVVPLARCTLRVNREAWSYYPGMPFKLSWPKLGISSLVMRVASVDLGTLTDGFITIECVEDRFKIGASQFSATTSTSWVDPTAASPDDSLVKEIINSTTTTPPSSPATGDSYIIPAGATGAWSGKTNQIATWNGTAWVYEVTADLQNKTVYDLASGNYKYYDNNQWNTYGVGIEVQEEGVKVGVKEKLNFIGQGITAALDSINNRINVTLAAFVGDSGAGGTGGAVPPPATGDAAAKKFLSAKGTWEKITTTGGASGSTSNTAPAVVTKSASAADSQAGSAWTDVAGITCDVYPSEADAALWCEFCYDLAADLGSNASIRFSLDGVTFSETYLRKTSGMVHAVLTGVSAGFHQVNVQWNGVAATLDQRRLSVFVGQNPETGELNSTINFRLPM